MSLDTHQGTSANGTPDKSPSESIDQVRDLLFGAQMRAVDARIQSLEDMLKREVAAIRADLRDSVKNLDSRVSSELTRLTGELQADKMDAAALASGLMDLAKRISPQGERQNKQASTDRT